MPNTDSNGRFCSANTGSARSCYCCSTKYTGLCDHPMTGRVFAGLTCDNKICDDHTVTVNGKKLCPYHADQKGTKQWA